MEKLISFGIPCYNSEKYMSTCIDSILPGGTDVEIIIVDDGSTDKTGDIADAYMKKYPDIIKVIHKKNGGHGSGINASLAVACGQYFKVVDSDDKIDKNVLIKVLNQIKQHAKEGKEVDLYITNFIYDKQSEKTYHVSDYVGLLEENKISQWNNIKKFRKSKLMLMHALMYRRKILIESGLELPEHTYYVDNIFAYTPLPFVKNYFYMNENFYWYFIGREDQSVNENVFSKKYTQQIRVMLCLVKSYSYSDIKLLPRGLKNYMFHVLNDMIITTLFFSCNGMEKQRKTDIKKMWEEIKENDKSMYNWLRFRSYVVFVNFLPWKLRRKVMHFGYNVCCKKVKLG